MSESESVYASVSIRPSGGAWWLLFVSALVAPIIGNFVMIGWLGGDGRAPSWAVATCALATLATPILFFLTVRGIGIRWQFAAPVALLASMAMLIGVYSLAATAI